MSDSPDAVTPLSPHPTPSPTPEGTSFCPNCDVTMDLHPYDDDDYSGCAIAEQKARLLEQFGRMTP